MKRTFFWIMILVATWVRAQYPKNTLSLLFMGDIMGHQPQIDGAFNPQTQKYDYRPVFDKIKPHFLQNDYAIGNLEVTLAGKPYKGYPQFSSPDELAVACRNAGINVLVTANNHSCDGGKKGIVRTLEVLDFLTIAHTGTFRDTEEFEHKNLLKLSANGISIGILNYTYGTNGLSIPQPTVVNQIDFEKMKLDIEKALNEDIDKLIIFIHWGDEYKNLQSKTQEQVAEFLFKNGADVIIGSHPHVLQPMVYTPKTDTQKERLVVYSLGNFVSNQRTSPRDGGAMYELVFERKDNEVLIKNHGYHLIWVNKTPVNNRSLFEILPCKEYEQANFKDLNDTAKKQMQIFINHSRNLFKKHNVNVKEL